jgi:hypothetical protein
MSPDRNGFFQRGGKAVTRLFPQERRGKPENSLNNFESAILKDISTDRPRDVGLYIYI